MDPSMGSGGLVNHPLGSGQTGTNHNGWFPSPAEDDEIPLDSTTEDSDVSMLDSEPEDKPEELQNSLISTGNENHPVQNQQLVPAAQYSQDISRKRKTPEADNTHRNVLSKKIKLDDEDPSRSLSTVACPLDKSLLPAEIWHRIFTFTPPRTLGNFLSVNKLFSVYLDPSSPYHYKTPSPLSQSSSRLLKPDVIWQLSRRRFWPRMPTPLQQKTELDMWRLACGRRCQFCGKPDSLSTNSSHNQNDCRHQPIWPFALRSCESCLVEKTMKEIDLLLSSTPSLLTSALPFTFMTNEKRIISPDALQKGVAQPGMQVTKIYLSEHVEKLKQEFLSAKSMGGATAEEWLKGLEIRGKELLNDSMRWEKWTSSGGVAQMQTQISSDSALSAVIPSNKGQASADSSLAPKALLISSSTAGQRMSTLGYTTSTAAVSQSAPTPEVTSPHGPTTGMSSLPMSVHSNGSRARTREEVLELKAARRAEIERRAMELDPPLPPNVLAHIPAFQAAIQIISSLDDHAWDLLKPRLLSQRAAAEQRERYGRGVSSTQPGLLPEQSEEPGQTEASVMMTKQLIDKAWDDVQEPLRAQISTYADEIIRDSWNDGRSVDTENSPQFAAEVLLRVRKRFYAEIEKESTAARAAGREPSEDPPDGPFTRKLTLENMKWLFDVKIKPHTESYRKDLFFCNGCEVSFKAFGFEGVIQHYAAKHTNALSLGSVVVHWRAEWPEIPPFKADTHVVTAAPSVSSYGNLQHQGSNNPYRRNTGSYPTGSTLTPFQPSPYVTAPPSYGNPAYGPATQQLAPYGHGNPCIQGQQQYAPSYPPHTSPYSPQGTIYPKSHLPFSPGMYTESITYSPTMTSYPGHSYNIPQNMSQVHFQNPPGTFLVNKYHVELEYLARISRELWTSTAGLKELPGNIRVHVVIYHAVKRFRSRFHESPPLSMFIDGLSNNKEMRPVRNVNGLMCKACHLNLGNQATTEQDIKTFSLPQLVNHFQQRHVNQPLAIGVPYLDWTLNMVHIPDFSSLSGLQYLVNIDGQKSTLIYSAFPSTQYPSSYPQDAPTADTQTDVEIVTFTSQQVPSSDPVLFYTAFKHDEVNLRSKQDLARFTTASQKLNSDQSMVTSSPSPATHQKLQQRTKTRKQGRPLPKDHRKTSSHSFKKRKGNVSDTSARIKSQEPSEGDLITEEERHQEEEIRAMWAAERREAALVASKSKPPTRVAESEIGSPRGHSASPAERPQEPTIFQEHEEDDLMAGLESQLNRQQVVSERFDYRSHEDRDLYREKQPLYREQDGPEPHGYLIQDRYEQVTLASAGYVRHESARCFDQYEVPDTSLSSIHHGHGSTRPITPLDRTLHGRPSRQEYCQAYADDPRARPPIPEYATAYEVVRVQDPHGEYLIKRPIRLERESTYVASQDRPTYDDAAGQYRSHREDDTSSNRFRYESDLRTDLPPRQPIHDPSFMEEVGMAKRSYESFSGGDATTYNSYDPRVSSGPPNSNVRRQTQY
ncbi:hypothetical protein F4811DRAFT_573996 [Daldinia bambusicola]|nr:hypothetical protein F4811DRAFT_573996 [Daldinia bambusicola]